MCFGQDTEEAHYEDVSEKEAILCVCIRAKKCRDAFGRDTLLMPVLRKSELHLQEGSSCFH